MRAIKVLLVVAALGAVVWTLTRGVSGPPVGADSGSPMAIAPSAPEPIVLPADFTGTAMDGSPFAGADLHGKVVLLDFWAVWCAPCINAIPKLNRIQAELGGSDFEVVGYAVNSGPIDGVRDFAREHDMRYRVVLGDDDLPYEYGVIGYPTYFLIDREGRQLRKYVGALPSLDDRVIADVREVLAATAR